MLQRYFEPQFTSKAGLMKRKEIREYSDRLIEEYDIRSGQGSSTIVRSMSGGKSAEGDRCKRDRQESGSSDCSAADTGSRHRSN